jgi:hypothetical protein
VTQRTASFRHLAPAAVVAACVTFALVGTAQAAPPPAAWTHTGASRYVTQPRLAPPKLKVVKKGKGKLAPGYFLISNFKNLGVTHTDGSPVPMTGQGGPIMYDRSLQPVWIHGVSSSRFANNFRSQSYNGKPALSWWEGNITKTGDVLSGEDFVVNQQYKIVAKLVGADGWKLSQHEFVIAGGHFVWATAYKDITTDLRPYGGSANGKVIDTAVQEYDLSTGKLLFNWDALQHISLKESEAQVPASSSTPWDAYHLNNVQVLPNGQFLVSMRNDWAAYLVDQTSGNVVWKLGGKNSTFKFGPNAGFSWQHDAQLHNDSTVSMFDNGCCGLTSAGKPIPPTGQTRGLVLKLDTTAHTATLVSQYTLRNVASGTQGNTQLLPNGNVMVGFGVAPYFAEYTKSGSILREVQLPSPDITYRALVGRWTGQPTSSPSGAAQSKGGGRATVYASWNGATNVYSWRVLAGRDSKHLATVTTKRRTGFETPIPLRSSYGAYQVVALGNKKQVLKRSPVFGVAKAKSKKPSSGGGGGGTTGGGGGFY